MTARTRARVSPRQSPIRGITIETWRSGPGLARDHARVSGQIRDGPGLVRAVGDGDVAARATLERHHDRLARGLASVINVLDPEVIVLGGGLSNVPGIAEAVGGDCRGGCSRIR
jgi:fructokinase